MKKTTKVFFILLVSFIVYGSCGHYVSVIVKPNEIRTTTTPHLFSISDSIYIDNETAFLSYGFSGNGSYSNPYRLEDLWISTSSLYAIQIQNTNSCFIIMNCIFNSSTNGIKLRNVGNNTATISNSSFSGFADGIGIYVENSTFLTIEDNSFMNSRTAIMTRLGTDNCYIINNSFENITSECFSIRDANKNVIDSNVCLNLGTFLYATFCNYQEVVNNNCTNIEQFSHISYSQNSDISNNICFNVTGLGINLDSTDFCNILNNQMNSGISAIKVSSSSNTNITSNLVYNFFKGLDIRKTRQCYIISNNFTKCGLIIEEIEKSQIATWIVNNNFVNDKELGFFRHKGTNFIVEGEFGQVILVSCIRVNVQNIRIKDTSVGIGLLYCDYTVIQNCSVSNTLYSFFIYESNYCNITSSECYNSTYGGIVDQSYGCEITYSECFDNENGFYLSSSEYFNLINNKIYNNIQYGIQLHFSDHCNIIDNEYYQNTMGIYLNFVSTILIKNNVISHHYSDPSINNHSAGIYSTVAVEVTIEGNSVFDNERGLFLLFSHYFSIIENNFRENVIGIMGTEILDSEINNNLFEANQNYAITLGFLSTGNIIHHNAFLMNNDGNVQVLDDGTNNTWYQKDEEEGNYWDNYQGTGNYSIDGSANSYDLYPLKKNPLEKSNNIYYSLFSLILIIPFAVITLKRLRNRNETKKH